MVSPGSARTTSTPWTPGIPFSCAVSGATGAAGPGPAAPFFVPGDTTWAAWFDTDTWSVSTFASAALPNRVRSLASCVVIATTATVVMNRASTRPLTARKAALGSSARRRAAISVPGRLVHRAMILAAAMVSHGPAMNRPTMMSAKLDSNAWTCPPMEAGWPWTVQKPSSARPASSGSIRQARGGFGVARRATPSGEMCTRRSASRAATTAATGTPIATARTSAGLSDRSPGKNGSPKNGMPATGVRSRKKIPNPAATLRIPAVVDSVAASRETCLRVAPARRIAANRSSRRAADSRVAVAMKISTGVSMPSATTDRMRSMPLDSIPALAGI